MAGVVGLRQRRRHQTVRYPVCARCLKRALTLLCTRMHLLHLLLVIILAMLDLAYSDFDFGFITSLVALLPPARIEDWNINSLLCDGRYYARMVNTPVRTLGFATWTGRFDRLKLCVTLQTYNPAGPRVVYQSNLAASIPAH